MECICMGFLGICTGYDYQTKTIPVWTFWVFGSVAVLIRLWKGSLFAPSFVFAVGSGVILWFVGHFTKKIGEGDGLMLVVLSLLMGNSTSIQVFFWALVLAAAVSVGLLIGRKGTLRTEIPFAPFLLVSYTVFEAANRVAV